MKNLIVFFVLTCTSSLAFAHGMSAEDQAFALEAGLFDFVKLGAKHMLTGYDHLLFLFGVMFPLMFFKDVVKFITVFTIGHCITLITATLLTIQANYFLVDAVIALTVCYKAFDNLGGFEKFWDMRAPNLLPMVFGFGLIHGFGLSTRLQQLPLGEEGIVMKILAFNVGVEVGQVVALGVMVAILAVWRKWPSFNALSRMSNTALFALGILLFLMQMHDWHHVRSPDSFPLNQDDHYHIHEHMDEHAHSESHH